MAAYANGLDGGSVSCGVENNRYGCEGEAGAKKTDPFKG